MTAWAPGSVAPAKNRLASWPGGVFLGFWGVLCRWMGGSGRVDSIAGGLYTGGAMVNRLTAVVLAGAMLVPSGAIGAVLYLCQMDGEVRTSCCCDEAAAAAGEGPCTAIESASCCDVRVAEADRVPMTVVHVVDSLQAPVGVAVATFAPARGLQSRLGGRGMVLGARGPPAGLGPPIFVRDCSYLI